MPGEWNVPSLAATVASVMSEVGENDQIVLITDGWNVDIDAVWASLIDCPTEATLIRHPRLGGWGHGLRNYALDYAVARAFVAHLDDDDVWLPGTMTAMRSALAEKLGVHVFRATWGPGHPASGVTCWQQQILSRGNVGTPMVLAPCCTARFGLEYDGDFAYFQDLQTIFGEFMWHDTVIAEIRPVVAEMMA